MSTRRRNPRQRRLWTLLQLSGIGLLVAAAVTLGLGVGAGATPSSGSILPGSAVCAETCTAGIPFDSGQLINIVVPANSAFAAPNNNSGVNIVECSAPDGVPPTLPTSCDGNTLQNGALVNPDGSLTFNGFTVYALPDSIQLGEGGSSTVICGNTAATECILYIGNDQLDFTQPHLWSQPFFVNTDPTDSGTINPGDGSGAAVATVPSAALSTAVASPTTPTADGVDQSTVTVTLLGSGSVPVANKAVSLTPSSSTAKVTGPSPALTGANGQTMFTVTDTVAEPVTLTAADTTDTVTVTQKPVVTFQAPQVDASHSTVSANPTIVTSGNSTTITVTLRDQGANPQPVAGQTVTLADGAGNAVITPTATPNMTNPSGVATFTATDPDAETVTFTATTGSTVIANTASVTFGNPTVSGSQSTVTATSPAPLGSAGTTVFVTLLTSTNSPVAGKAVSLSSTGGAVVGAPSPALTGSNGQVQFSLTDSVAESVTLTATDTTDGTQLTSQPVVVFTSNSPSATASTMTAQGTTAPADGETQLAIAVTVNDQFGDALPGKVVTLQGAPSTNVQIHPFSTGSTAAGTTDSSGRAEFEVDDSAAETVTFTATDTTDNLVLAPTATITFTPGPADPSALGTTVTVAPANPPADGSTPSTVTVTLADFFSNPIAGKTIGLISLNGSSKITPVNPVTNQAGQATFTVTDSTAEVVTYQATDVTDGNAVINAEGVVKFGNPPSPPAVAAFCDVLVSPSSVPANGTTTATISVLLSDGNGEPVTGKTVTLTAAAGTSKMTATNATTNNSGMATFAVTDSTVESVQYTADDTTDSVNLTALPVTVSFTAAASSTTTTSTTTTTTTTTTTSGTTGSTTTTAAAGSVTSGSSSSGATGNTGTAAGSTASLAETGPSMLLPWLIGFGALFLGIGAIGRRRFNGRRHDA